MTGHPAAALMAREATRRRLSAPQLEREHAAGRRRIAHALRALAHRLDPQVAPAPSHALGR